MRLLARPSPWRIVCTVPALSSHRWRGRSSVQHAHERQNGATMCHVEQPIQHGRPRYLVENAQPVNGNDCSLGILFAEALEHMSNALTPCSRGRRVLMRSGGPLDGFPDLPRNRSRSQSSDHVPCNNPSHTPISAMPSCAQLELLQPQLEERWPVTASRTSRRKNAEIEDVESGIAQEP